MILKVISFLIVIIAVVVTLFYQAVVLNPIHFRPVDLTGKIAIVTGGSSGIGLETVRKLVEWNATVIMPVRSIDKGELVRKDILSTNVYHTGSIELMTLDLTSFQSVRNFAAKIIEKNIHIDMLILNAGMQTSSPTPLATDDGIEIVYQVNHLSHFLLTRLLLPAFKHLPTRIVHVSSSMHYLGNLDHSAYSAESRNLSPSRLGTSVYCDTKLMNVVFSNALQDKLSKLPEYSQLTSVSIHPGFVISELDRGLNVEQYVRKIREYIARNTPEGAVTQVTAATLPDVIQYGGGLYFEDHCIMSNCQQSLLSSVYPKGGVTPHSTSLNENEKEWLWEVSSKLVGLKNEI